MQQHQIENTNAEGKSFINTRIQAPWVLVTQSDFLTFILNESNQ